MIYRQLLAQPDLESKWQAIKLALAGKGKWNIILALILVAVNWGLEALKWKLSVSPVQQMSFGRAFKAVLAGVALAVNTPNRMGEYIGRIFYMDEGKRLKTISLTIVGSISQLIITLVMGNLALLYIRIFIPESTYSTLGISSFWLWVLQYGVLLSTAMLALLFFRLSWIVRMVEKLPGIARYSYMIEVLENFPAATLRKILTYSLLRYFVFIIQYLLLLSVFGVEAGWWQAFWMVSLQFLLLAIVPTIALAELGLRNEIAIKLLGLFSANTVGIFFTTFGIWIVNLLLPALAGSLLILRIKIFKNRHE